MIISTRDIPDTIRKLRQQANLSQQELADASGVNMHTITERILLRHIAKPDWYTYNGDHISTDTYKLLLEGSFKHE
jgi:transcriptional regulator with XRE-family HTH domain